MKRQRPRAVPYKRCGKRMGIQIDHAGGDEYDFRLIQEHFVMEISSTSFGIEYLQCKMVINRGRSLLISGEMRSSLCPSREVMPRSGIRRRKRNKRGRRRRFHIFDKTDLCILIANFCSMKFLDVIKLPFNSTSIPFTF